MVGKHGNQLADNKNAHHSLSCGQLGHGGCQGHLQNCSQSTCLNNQP
jgi:hypothetical protein